MGEPYGFPDPIEEQLVSEFLAMSRNVFNCFLFEAEVAGIPPDGVELMPIESHGDHKSDIGGPQPIRGGRIALYILALCVARDVATLDMRVRVSSPTMTRVDVSRG